MTIYAVNQTMIQRYLTVKDLRFFRAESPKNQPIKNKFWSDSLKKERNCGQNHQQKEERNYGQNRLKTKQKLSRTAKISIWLSGVAITVILSIVAYAGLVIYARYE